MNWWPVTLVFTIPFAVGTGCLHLASGIRREWARVAVRVVGWASLLVFLAAIVEFAPYLWALHLEGKWQAVNPTTKIQLESCLSLYSQREIRTSQSLWGRDHELRPGERMIQYRLLYGAPLDVVYTSSDTITAIYTSYE